MAITAPTNSAATKTPAAAGFIPEIQGLRTIALLLVATFHIWFDRVSGGVDIFLLISAYLMTRSLTARAEAGRYTRPIGFLAKKFARLLPAAAAVILLTLVATVVLLPANTWEGNAGDAVASALYVENFRLQAATVDYFAANDALASPFQHFWSLSIQGQVFVAWAFLHLLGELVARTTKIPVRWVLLAGFLIIFGVSLARSVWLTEFNQVYAYFDTWSRLWEFAAGSLLALVHPWIRIPRALRAIMSWVGIAGVLSCGFLLPVASSFPGYAALWPVVSAGLIILSSGGEAPAGVGRVLAAPVLARIGNYTYALYLTHWPVLVFFLNQQGINHVDAWQGLVVLILATVVAVVVVRLVERPAASWVAKPRTAAMASPVTKRVISWIRDVGWRAPAVIATSLALVFGGFAAITAQLERVRLENLELIQSADISALGANAPLDAEFEMPLQDPAYVKDDWVNVGPDCAPDDPYRSALCFEILPEGGTTERLILTIGNSHSTQFTGALLEVVERHPTWELRTRVAPGCNFSLYLQVEEPDDCAVMWNNASAFIADNNPDMVVVYATWWGPGYGDIRVDGIEEWLVAMRLVAPATEFVVVRDNPRLDISPFDCAVDLGFDDVNCYGQFEQADQSAWQKELESLGNTTWVDLTDAICPGSFCAPMRGGVVTYLDDNHLTETYARTLAQHLADILNPSVSWWPSDAYAGELIDRTPGGGIQDRLNK
ncbi:acyltransferase family protein [Gulosibacter macacae]|uniref:acyltransferase family protein n=1 Tax=Gulosibacter macacae TaxID=2488791 RepID=UPI00163AC714|nr:acyltransferase family protein [Gulosibacter macacae]